jgi:hypothetical protein
MMGAGLAKFFGSRDSTLWKSCTDPIYCKKKANSFSLRYLIGLYIPFLMQVVAYIAVFSASRGGGSFMGLLAIPVAAASVLTLLIVGFTGARGTRPLGGLAFTTLSIAFVPPIFLLIFRALES